MLILNICIITNYAIRKITNAHTQYLHNCKLYNTTYDVAKGFTINKK